MKTLNELATKLQTYIIKSQADSHNSTNMSISKYNNLKLKMDTKLNFPNVIITIGISESIYNFVDGTKTDGSLGPDERYVRKWLNSSNIISDLREIWVAMNELIKAEDEDKAVSMEGEADEAKFDDNRRKRRSSTAGLTTVDEFVEDLEQGIKEIATDGESGDESYISYDEEQARKFSSAYESHYESVDGIKEDIRNYLKSIYKKH
ncbi:MAG: hypothetical protein E7Z87_07640 [Cyanobacteria bacterium SIG26]|nr:hypothetical protein [Cyanobacteria bacterium SIG26]